MSIILTQPTDYPAAFLKRRINAPEYLYIAVTEANKIAISLAIPHYGKYSEYTKSNLEAHLARKPEDDHATSSLVSTYESEAAALKCATYSNKRIDSEKKGTLALCMKGIIPGWLVLAKGVHVPVWIEQKRDLTETVKDDVWICLQEARIVLGIDERLGEKEEWLACPPVIRHKISKSMVERTVVDDEEREEPDKRQARRQQHRMDENEGEAQCDQASHAKLRRSSSKASLLPPPHIPTRKSSLRSLSRKITSLPEESSSATAASSSPKLKITTRDATISLTNADHHRATSLMKYALLVAHGKRIEAEETWLLETVPLNQSVSRAGSLHTIGEEGDVQGEEEEEDGDIGCEGAAPETDTRSYITPPESWRGSAHQCNSDYYDADDDHNTSARAATCQGEDSDSIPEDRGRTKRSTAPSPSRSMLSQHVQKMRETLPLPPRRSRRELLLELQTDEDSLLREYARVSLQASAVFDGQVARDAGQQGSRTASSSHRQRQAHPRQDTFVAEDKDPSSSSSARQRNRLAASAYYTPPPPPQSTIYTTPTTPRLHQNTPQTSSPTLVNTPPSPSLYATPPSSSSQRTLLRKTDNDTGTPTPSKSEALMARGKGLREKGREISNRLAEIRERLPRAAEERRGGREEEGEGRVERRKKGSGKVDDLWGDIAEREE
ncbi:ferric reductase [Pyrenophora seminiperda CCB06]|uniref:Ferric reductase n=1 Tax=Pyrenophora seminiperda CCB06 TaxID=1302712 RepID=A0A3M7M6G3_9PLEO|nr:ferric reductase [Pyrenophora seminiperda CCB06]